MGKLGRCIGYSYVEWVIVPVKRVAQHKVASPREAIKKGYDVAVPELLIMILVEFGGETYRAEIGRCASCAGRNAPGCMLARLAIIRGHYCNMRIRTPTRIR